MPGLLSGDGWRRRRVALISLVASLAAFAVLAVVAMSQDPQSGVDAAVNAAVAAHRTPALDDFFIAYTGLGRWFILAAAAVAVVVGLSATRRLREAIFIAAALTIALLLNPYVKALFERARPPQEAAVIQVGWYSFPSGHAMSSATLALAVIVVAWPTRQRWPATIVAGTFAVLMGLSRVYLGVHWLTDILGGWALAVAVVAALALVLPSRPRERAGEGAQGS